MPGYEPTMVGRWSVAWVAIVYMLVGAAHQQQTVDEQMFTCVGMLLGACLSGVLVSKLSVYLSELNAERVIYATKIAQVTSEMKKRRMPQELQARGEGEVELEEAWGGGSTRRG